MSDWWDKFETSFRGRLIYPSAIYAPKPACSSVAGVFEALMGFRLKRDRQKLAGRFARELVRNREIQSTADNITQGYWMAKTWDEYFPGLYWTVGSAAYGATPRKSAEGVWCIPMYRGEIYTLVNNGDSTELRWEIFETIDDRLHIRIDAPYLLYRILGLFVERGVPLLPKIAGATTAMSWNERTRDNGTIHHCIGEHPPREGLPRRTKYACGESVSRGVLGDWMNSLNSDLCADNAPARIQVLFTDLWAVRYLRHMLSTMTQERVFVPSGRGFEIATNFLMENYHDPETGEVRAEEFQRFAFEVVQKWGVVSLVEGQPDDLLVLYPRRWTLVEELPFSLYGWRAERLSPKVSLWSDEDYEPPVFFQSDGKWYCASRSMFHMIALPETGRIAPSGRGMCQLREEISEALNATVEAENYLKSGWHTPLGFNNKGWIYQCVGLHEIRSRCGLGAEDRRLIFREGEQQ